MYPDQDHAKSFGSDPILICIRFRIQKTAKKRKYYCNMQSNKRKRQKFKDQILCEKYLYEKKFM